MIVAAGWLLVMTRSTGSTVSVLGATPKLHIRTAPLQTCCGMGHLHLGGWGRATAKILPWSDFPIPLFTEQEHRVRACVSRPALTEPADCRRASVSEERLAFDSIGSKAFPFEPIYNHFGWRSARVEIESVAIWAAPNVNRAGLLPMLRPHPYLSGLSYLVIHKILQFLFGSVTK
jgi:hypothetical protein